MALIRPIGGNGGTATDYTLSLKTFGAQSCIFDASTIPNYVDLTMNQNIFMNTLPSYYNRTGGDVPCEVSWSYDAANGEFTVTVSHVSVFIQQYVGTCKVTVIS